MSKKITLTFIIFIFVATGNLFMLNAKDNYSSGKGLNINSKISFTLPDQFDKAHTLNNRTKKIIFVFAKATGHTVKEFLKKQNKDYLSKRDTLFVADMSSIPTIFRNLFAMPDLKKSNYSILLIYDKDTSKKYKDESKADKISIVSLQNGTIKSIKYITTKEELKTALQ